MSSKKTRTRACTTCDSIELREIERGRERNSNNGIMLFVCFEWLSFYTKVVLHSFHRSFLVHSFLLFFFPQKRRLHFDCVRFYFTHQISSIFMEFLWKNVCNVTKSTGNDKKWFFRRFHISAIDKTRLFARSLSKEDNRMLTPSNSIVHFAHWNGIYAIWHVW